MEEQSSTDETADGLAGWLALLFIGIPLFVLTPLACFIGLFFGLFHALGLPNLIAIPFAVPPGLGMFAFMYFALHKGWIVWED